MRPVATLPIKNGQWIRAMTTDPEVHMQDVFTADQLRAAVLGALLEAINRMNQQQSSVKVLYHMIEEVKNERHRNAA